LLKESYFHWNPWRTGSVGLDIRVCWITTFFLYSKAAKYSCSCTGFKTLAQERGSVVRCTHRPPLHVRSSIKSV